MACLVLQGWLLPAKAVTDEEFGGPFPSWLDVKRDFGAKGDGQADDTAALQAALDELREHKRACVLYLPAGTYRLTQGLKTTRKGHTDNMVTVVGEDPAKVILKWDGPEGGTMFQWDAWYAKLSRLTFDGAGRAGTCLSYGPAFSTYNETSDLVLRDAKNGIIFGAPGTQGQAENEVLRCQFLRCETGLQTVNWNSMDIWVWYCRFEDCGRGIHNVMGNWHAWENLFLRSKTSDVSLQNLMAFSVVNNTSIGSNRLLDFSSGHTWGSPTSITGNRVINPTCDWAMVLDNAGPYLLVDNQFRLTEKCRAVRMTWADQTLVGNIYSRPDAAPQPVEPLVEERGRFRRIAEKVVKAEEISEALPELPPAPPHATRPIFEVPATANAEAIQAAIDAAAQLAGKRPVVHLPIGAYKINRTLVLPRGCDVQLVGDGASEIATRLVWTGPAETSTNEAVVLRIAGPSKATIRDLHIQAGLAQALQITIPDAQGGRVFADQLNVNGPTAQTVGRTTALRVSGCDQTQVQLRALQGSGNAGTWVEVEGSGGENSTGQAVTILTGATGSAAGQYNVVRGGRLVVRSVYHEKSSDATTGLHLTDNGTLSIDATRFSYATSEKSPTVATDSFQGLFTLATCMLMPVDTQETCRFELRGDGSHTSVLALNNQFWVSKPGTSAQTVWLNKANPPACGGIVGSNINTSNKEASPRGFEFLHNIGDNQDPARSKFGSGPLADSQGVDDATIVRHLAPLRGVRPWLPTATPTGITDLRFQRVIVSGGRGTVMELQATK